MKSPLRLLLVEDDENDAALLIRTLEREGVEVQWTRVQTAEAMARELDGSAWDVVISDYSMPHFSGSEALELLTRSGIDVPFILVSGAVGEDVAVAMMKAGAQDFIMKGQWKRIAPAVERELAEQGVRRERRKALAALEISEQQYRGLVERISDLVILLDGRSLCTFVTPSCAAILGYTPEELVGKPPFPMAEPDDAGRIRDALAGNARGEIVEGVEIRVRRKDGSLGVLDCVGLPVMEEGRVAGVQLVCRDITERTRAEAELRASLEEKEVLLKEVHHRVKNNMQVVSSLLSIQASKIEEEPTRELFRESQHRIRAMALVHEKLYRSGNLASIEFDEYARSVSEELAHSYGRGGAACTIDADPFSLGIDQAIPAGLVLNELITNAFKHAFPDGNRGSVDVSIRIRGEEVELIVRDRGVGLPAPDTLTQARSMGMVLIRSLAGQLGGSIETGEGPGTAITLKFTRRHEPPG
jgi:PAS domain S-box-containing protein